MLCTYVHTYYRMCSTYNSSLRVLSIEKRKLCTNKTACIYVLLSTIWHGRYLRCWAMQLWSLLLSRSQEWQVKNVSDWYKNDVLVLTYTSSYQGNKTTKNWVRCDCVIVIIWEGRAWAQIHQTTLEGPVKCLFWLSQARKSSGARTEWIARIFFTAWEY